MQRAQCVYLDDRGDIGEDDIVQQVYNVARLSPQMRHQLHRTRHDQPKQIHRPHLQRGTTTAAVITAR